MDNALVPHHEVGMREMTSMQFSSGRGLAGVVLAEPCPEVRAAFTAALADVEAKVSIRWFDDGARCLAYLRNLDLPRGEPAPRLLLLSFHLPVIDGMQVLKRLRNGKVRRGLPVVMTGTPADVGLVRPAYENGANSCVLLPDDADHRSLSIATVLEYWARVVIGPPLEVRA